MRKQLRQLFIKFKYKGVARTKLFSYFIVVNLLAAGIVGSLLYWRSSSALEKETILSEQNMLIQLSKTIEIMTGQVDNFLTRVANEPNILKMPEFFKTKNIDEIMLVNESLNEMKIMTDYIYNISFYYTEDAKIYEVDNGIYEIEDYPHKDLIKSVCKFPISTKKAPLFKIKELNGDMLNVVSIVKPIPMNGTLPDAYTVVNIKEGYFRNIINSLVEKEGMEIYIANQDGEIISGSNPAGRYKQLINTGYFNTFDASPSGYKIDTLNNEKVLVSLVTSKDYQWKYVSIIPHDAVVENVQFIKSYTVIVYFLAVIAGLILSLLFSKRISKPINSIAELLKDTGSSGNDRNVYEYIQRNISTLVEKNETFEKNMNEHMPVLRNNYITNILMGNVPEEEELVNRLEYYGVDADFNSRYIVCIIPLDNYRKLSGKYSEQQMNMLMVYLIEVLNQFVNSGSKGLVINTKPDEIVILLELSRDGKMDEGRRMVETLAVEMQKTILKNIKYTAAVGIGGICADFSKIPNSYEEAQYALNHRLLLGNSSVIFYEDIKNMQDESFRYPFKAEKKLLDVLLSGDEAAALQINREIFRDFISNSSEKEDIFYYYMQLLNSVIKCAFELGINLESISQENNLYREVLKCKNVIEVQEFFEGLYISICELVEGRKKSKTHNVVQDLEDYINKNYQKDLSLRVLADRVYMSVAYMRKVFKDNTGKSVKQYINEVRLEKAKELLKDSRLKISEVAEMIGYDKVHAFIYFFKENTNMTPGEYREMSGMDRDSQ